MRRRHGARQGRRSWSQEEQLSAPGSSMETIGGSHADCCGNPAILLTALLQFHPAAHSASSIKQRFLGYTEEEPGVCLPGQVG